MKSVKPWITFAGGVLVVAALEGWTGPLMVLALFVVLELVTNLVLETVLALLMVC